MTFDAYVFVNIYVNILIVSAIATVWNQILDFFILFCPAHCTFIVLHYFRYSLQISDAIFLVY